MSAPEWGAIYFFVEFMRDTVSNSMFGRFSWTVPLKISGHVYWSLYLFFFSVAGNSDFQGEIKQENFIPAKTCLDTLQEFLVLPIKLNTQIFFSFSAVFYSNFYLLVKLTLFKI